MARYNRFTFLVNKDERRLIATLAERLQRSQSDAVRFVVLEKARELESQKHAPQSAGGQNVAAAS